MPFWYICHLQSQSEQAESSLLFPDHSTSPCSEFKSPYIRWKEPIRSPSVCPECFPHSVYPTSRKRACPDRYMLHPKCKAKKPFQTCTCGRKHPGVAVETQYSQALLKKLKDVKFLPSQHQMQEQNTFKREQYLKIIIIWETKKNLQDLKISKRNAKVITSVPRRWSRAHITHTSF